MDLREAAGACRLDLFETQTYEVLPRYRYDEDIYCRRPHTDQ